MSLSPQGAGERLEKHDAFRSPIDYEAWHSDRNPVTSDIGSCETSGPSLRNAARVMVAMMFLGYTVNFIDRQIVSVLVEPIKAELQISDGQVGLLTGMSFAIFYATMGLPIAALADRLSRKRIIVFAMTLWSAATVLFGLAQTYPEMFLARMAVGVGEAGFAPAAISMIADYYPLKHRGTAIAIGAMGAMAGTTLGLMIGGYVAQRAGWRTATLAAGVPGLALAMLFALVVKEPRRGLSGGTIAGSSDAPPVRLLLRNPTYLQVVGAGMSAMCVLFACAQWVPTYLIRSYHMTGREAGAILGPMLGSIGAASLLSSGYAMDVLSRKDIRWGAWLPGIGAFLGAPLFAAAFYANGRTAMLVLFAMGYFALMFTSAPNTAMIQSLVPVGLRARATAFFLMMTTLVGFGFGPMAAGYLSEAYRPSFGQESLRYSLMTLAPLSLIAPVLLYFAARGLSRSPVASL